MKRKRHSDEQIAFALRQADGGAAVEGICRLKQLEEGNAKLKRLVADLSLGKTMLQDALRKKWQGPACGVTWWACSRAPIRSASAGPARRWGLGDRRAVAGPGVTCRQRCGCG